MEVLYGIAAQRLSGSALSPGSTCFAGLRKHLLRQKKGTGGEGLGETLVCFQKQFYDCMMTIVRIMTMMIIVRVMTMMIIIRKMTMMIIVRIMTMMITIIIMTMMIIVRIMTMMITVNKKKNRSTKI